MYATYPDHLFVVDFFVEHYVTNYEVFRYLLLTFSTWFFLRHLSNISDSRLSSNSVDIDFFCRVKVQISGAYNSVFPITGVGLINIRIIQRRINSCLPFYNRCSALYGESTTLCEVLWKLFIIAYSTHQNLCPVDTSALSLCAVFLLLICSAVRLKRRYNFGDFLFSKNEPFFPVERLKFTLLSCLCAS